jgi:hypothetical protein
MKNNVESTHWQARVYQSELELFEPSPASRDLLPHPADGLQQSNQINPKKILPKEEKK